MILLLATALRNGTFIIVWNTFFQITFTVTGIHVCESSTFFIHNFSVHLSPITHYPYED